jgi:hypothetical protein
VRIGQREQDASLTGKLSVIRLARAHCENGDLDRCEVSLRKALDELLHLEGREDLRAKAMAQLAEVHVLRGEAQEGYALASEAASLTARCDRTETPLVLRARAFAERALGDRKAWATLSEALDRSREMGMRLEEARALTALGVLEGNPLGPHFREAREIFARCGSERGLAEVRKAVAGLSS